MPSIINLNSTAYGAWQTPRKIAPTDKEPAMAAQDHDQNTVPSPSLRPNRKDPLHDLQLVRDLEAVNARCTREIGALPPGGLPVQPRRKPVLSKPEPAAQATPPEHPAAEKQDQSQSERPPMGFVNEYIPAEDFERYGLHEIDRRQASAVRARDWTVDREREIYLRELNRGREEFSYESYWTFFWRGAAYTIELHAIDGGGRPGAPGWAKWGLVRVNGRDAPAGLPEPAETFLADLHDALLAYKDGGWFAQCTDFEVEVVPGLERRP